MIQDIDIINSALARIGIQEVTSLHEATPSAIYGRAAWRSSFQAFLSEYPWSWATRMTAIAPVAQSAVNTPQIAPYRNAYLLPQGLVQILRVHLTGCLGMPVTRVRVSWAYVHELQYTLRTVCGVRMLLSNHDLDHLEYITTEFDLTQIPAAAREALEVRLAMYLDVALKGGMLQQQLVQMYQFVYANAVRVEASSRPRDSIGPTMSTWGRNGF